VAETEIVEHSQPRPRSAQTDQHAKIEIGANPSPFPTVNQHAKIEIGAKPSPFPTVNHHATTKSTENRGKLWRTKNREESIGKEKKKKKP
jgi:hypothetical protein